MSNYKFFNSKELSVGKTYDLSNVADRKKYFEDKLGSKIDQVKEYLEKNNFVGYMLSRKMAGKGTYAKMIEEILGSERFVHISVGDIVRDNHAILASDAKENLMLKLKKIYRGTISLDDAVNALLGRTQDKVSVPTELILSLLKLEVSKIGNKSLFIDGLPRTTDQVSYSLFFRDLINYRDDKDFFVFIDVPEEVIDARIRYRRVCPICHTSKNIMFNPSTFVDYDSSSKTFFLKCDNKICTGYGKQVLIEKEGDSLGKSHIADRIKLDTEIMEHAMSMHGIDKVFIPSALPITMSASFLDDYEVQKRIKYENKGHTVEKFYEPWVFKDDAGLECCTFNSATFVLNLFSQIHSLLILE